MSELGADLSVVVVCTVTGHTGLRLSIGTARRLTVAYSGPLALVEHAWWSGPRWGWDGLLEHLVGLTDPTDRYALTGVGSPPWQAENLLDRLADVDPAGYAPRHQVLDLPREADSRHRHPTARPSPARSPIPITPRRTA